MKMREKGASFKKGSTVAIGLLFISFIAFTDTAHAIHKGAGDLVCGSCHTMHNSQGGSSLGGNTGGSLMLLRGAVNTRAEIHKFCLQCHATNGAQASTLHAPQNVMAPKVWSSATWTEDDPFNKIGSGGNFSPELDANWDATTPNILGFGHSLGASSVTPPGGDAQIPTFSCTNCHDPHGTSSLTTVDINLFRNLKVNPTGAGLNSGVKFLNMPATPYYEMHSYVGGVNGTYFGGGETDNGGNTIWPVYRGTLTGNPVTDSVNSNSYATGWDGPINAMTMSKWCAQCHDAWHEDFPEGANNQAHDYTPTPQYQLQLDTKRHAVNSMVPRAAAQNCASICHVSLLDRSNYNNALIIAGKGLPVTASMFYTSNAYYLPECGSAGNPVCSGMDDISGSRNHKVFCLSCHFAHGGPNYDNLRWNYLYAVGAGSEVGNAVPSNKGCQLCHNRAG